MELSTKVVDTPEKLRRTLLHELCHVAAWLVNHIAKPPHGAAFKYWAGEPSDCLGLQENSNLRITTGYVYAFMIPVKRGDEVL